METSQQILILYATVDGHTQKICDQIVEHIREKEVRVQIFPLENFNADLRNFDTLVIGAAVRYGKHSRTVHEFIETHRKELRNMRTVFFSVNLVARNSDKNDPATNPYFQKFLKETRWEPDLAEVFAGKLDYRVYSFLDKLMIKLIMKMTKGPTRTPVPIEYTNWERVKEFSQKILRLEKDHKEV